MNSISNFISNKLAIGTSDNSNTNAIISLAKNNFIASNDNTGFLGIAASNDFSAGSKIVLNGNNSVSSGSLNLQSGNTSNASINLYTANDSLKMSILNNGTTVFSPDGFNNSVVFSNTQSNFNTDVVLIRSTTVSSGPTTGALTVAGGLGVLGDLNITGRLNASAGITYADATPSLNFSTGSIVIKGGLSVSGTVNSTGATSGGGLSVAGGMTIAKDTYISGITTLLNTTPSTNSITGALVMYGGMGINGNLNLRNANTSQLTLTPNISGQETSIRFFSLNNSVSGNATGSSWSIGHNNVTIGSGKFGISNSSLGNILTINNNGLVGIRNTDPTASLDVTGDINFSGNLFQNGKLFVSGSGTGTTSAISSQWTSGTGGTLFFNGVDLAQAFVGINTSSPQTNFDVNGTVNLRSLTTIANLNTPQARINNLVSDNLNLGTSNMYSGTFYAQAGVTTGSAVTGLLFNTSGIRTFQIYLNVTISVTSGQNLYETFNIDGTQNDSIWYLLTSSYGDVSGVKFTINNSGQILYTSPNVANLNTILFSFNVIQMSSNGLYSNMFNTSNSGSALAISNGNIFLLNSTFANLLNSSIGTLNANGITAGNINILGNLFQNGSPYASSQFITRTGGAISYTVTSGNALVGINTTSPKAALDVNGSLKALNATISNLLIQNSTMSSFYIDNLNVGLSSSFSGSFSASNGGSGDITGLSFSSDIRSFVINLTVTIIKSDNQNIYETFTLEGIQGNNTWTLLFSSFGDVSNVTFSITNMGQIQYSSVSISNFVSNTFRYSVSQILSNGLYNSISQNTSSSYIIDTLQISNTTDAVPGINNGALYVLGGATINKSLSLNGSLSMNGSSFMYTGSFNANNGPISNAPVSNLLFSSNTYRSFIIQMSISVSANINIYSQVTIEGIQQNSGWVIYTTTLGDTIDIIFDINNSGQILYNSNTTYAGWISTIFNFNVNLIAITSGNAPITLPTTGNQTITGTLNISNTNNATTVSSGALTIVGGVGIAKDLLVGGSINISNNSNTLGNIFTTAGNIGINTTAPQTAIHFQNVSSGQLLGLNLTTSGNSFAGFGVTVGNILYQAGTTGQHIFYSGSSLGNLGSERMRLTSAGNLGIGTSTPQFPLDVNGTVRTQTPIVYLRNTSSNTGTTFLQNWSFSTFNRGGMWSNASAANIYFPISGMYNITSYSHTYILGSTTTYLSSSTLNFFNTAGSNYSSISLNKYAGQYTGNNDDWYTDFTYSEFCSAGSYLQIVFTTNVGSAQYNYLGNYNRATIKCLEPL